MVLNGIYEPGLDKFLKSIWIYQLLNLNVFVTHYQSLRVLIKTMNDKTTLNKLYDVALFLKLLFNSLNNI